MSVFETYFNGELHFVIALVKQGSFVREAPYSNEKAADEARAFYERDYRKYELLDMMWKTIPHPADLDTICDSISRKREPIDKFSLFNINSRFS